MSAFTKDQKFTSFEDFRAQLDDWAIKDHFRPKFYKSDPTRRIVKCKDTECPFYIRASFKEGLGVVIVPVHPENRIFFLTPTKLFLLNGSFSKII